MEIRDSRGASSKTNKNYEIISRQITADGKEKNIMIGFNRLSVTSLEGVEYSKKLIFK
jgi:hypothetical protein